jgi:hypothetical protein
MMMLFDDKKMEDFEDMMVLYSVISRSRYIFILFTTHLIRYYVVGYIRPMRDHDIITTSWILKTPEKIVSAMEYLFADTEEFKLFNVLSVIIEHVNVEKIRISREQISGLLYVLFYMIHS